MPNFLELMRLKNIFGGDLSTPPPGIDMTGPMDLMSGMPKKNPYDVSFGSTEINPNQPNPMAMDTGSMGPKPFDVKSRMSELYTPETTATDRFNQLAGNMPGEEKPGFWRSIAAMLTDMKYGHQAGMNVARQPYNDKMNRWKTEIEPAQSAANLERQNNANERTMSYQTVSQELKAEADNAKAANDVKRSEIAAGRAEVYRYKAMNPGVKFDFRGPTVMVADPTTGKVTDTGIATGNMTTMDRLNLEHENRLEAIGATGDESRKTVETKHGFITEEIAQRGEESRKTKGTPSALSSTNKGELPTQTKVRQFNAARKVANQRPDLAKWIKFGNSNNFTITPPSSGGWLSGNGPSKQQHDELNNLIYGGDLPIPQSTRTAGPTTGTPVKPQSSNTPQAPQAPPGWKYVPKPGGGWTAVKAG